MVLRNTAALLALRLRDYHPLWYGFPGHFVFCLQITVCRSYNPERAETLSVWAIPRSLATTWGVTIVFLSSGYLDVSVPRVGLHDLCVQPWMTGLQPAGFSHSEIHGSRVVCTSPWLIAAYHVLLRLLVPRHPPCALLRLSSRSSDSVPKSIYMPAGERELSTGVRSVFYSTDTTLIRTGARAPATGRALCQSYYGYQHVKERPAAPIEASGPVVELAGFEPATPCLQSRCSTN